MRGAPGKQGLGKEIGSLSGVTGQLGWGSGGSQCGWTPAPLQGSDQEDIVQGFVSRMWV